MSIIDDAGSVVPFGSTFVRAGAALVNKAVDDVFNLTGDATRQSVVNIYNRTDNPIFFVDASFDSGGFTTGKVAPFQIDGKTANAYRVESHGVGTGVTGAHIRYAFSQPVQGADPEVVLDINTSNPFAGSNHAEVQAFNAEGVNFNTVNRVSVGDSNEVDIDFFTS